MLYGFHGSVTIESVYAYVKLFQFTDILGYLLQCLIINGTYKAQNLSKNSERTKNNLEKHTKTMNYELMEQMRCQMSLELQESSDVTKAAWKGVPNSRAAKWNERSLAKVSDDFKGSFYWSVMTSRAVWVAPPLLKQTLPKSNLPEKHLTRKRGSLTFLIPATKRNIWLSRGTW